MEVSKNSSTARPRRTGEFDTSTTTEAPASASASPSPVRVLTPVFGDAGTTSWPCSPSLVTSFEPIRPVPPMTTIFMVSPFVSRERRALQEGEQVGVDLILVRGRDAVRRARVVDFLRALDEPRRLAGRVVDGDDLVVLAMHDQRRHVELLEILGEVGLREGLDALVGVLEAGLHAPRPKLVQDALGHLGAGPVRAVELERQVPVELGSVVEQAGAHAVERLDRQALGVGGVLSMSGGTAAIRTALATRAVPCRPMYRATSPPPVE